jgi:hypothetical protein
LNRYITFIKNNALIIILSILPPIGIWFFLQREHRDLQVTIRTNVPVVSFESRFSKDVEIRYQSNPIKSLHAIEIEVKNSGNRPIERSDFDIPLTFSFPGTVAGTPEVIESTPPGLAVGFQTQPPNTLTLKPLLLNGGDALAFRVLVVDLSDKEPPVRITARVLGVKSINIERLATQGRESREIILFGVTLLLGGISLVSTFLLTKKVRGLTISLPLGVVVALTKKLEEEPSTAMHARELARQLNIAQHDFKSNLLLLRIKIESQLRELAHTQQLPKREQLGSVSTLARALETQGVIPHEVAAAVRDVLPAVNRELHEAETYLGGKEFEALQQLGLSVVAALDGILKDQPRNPVRNVSTQTQS